MSSLLSFPGNRSIPSKFRDIGAFLSREAKRGSIVDGKTSEFEFDARVAFGGLMKHIQFLHGTFCRPSVHVHPSFRVQVLPKIIEIGTRRNSSPSSLCGDCGCGSSNSCPYVSRGSSVLDEGYVTGENDQNVNVLHQDDFHTQSDLVKFLHLPERFRLRDIRRMLLDKCDVSQREYIRMYYPHSEMINRLPHRLTARHFATCCVLLAFHISAMLGEIPGFWDAIDKRKLQWCVHKELRDNFSPELGVRVFFRQRINSQVETFGESIRVCCGMSGSSLVHPRLCTS